MGKKILWLLIAGGAVMIVLVLIAYVVANRRAAALLEARIDALRKAGEPVSLADLAPKPVPAEENAATLLARAQRETGPAALELVLQAADAPSYAPLHDYRQPPQAFQEKHLKAMGDNRSAARLLHAHALSQLQAGELDAALTTCLAMLRLTRHFDREPGMNSYLMSLAVRGMALDAVAKTLYAGRISDESHAALERELATDSGMPGFVQCLRSERAMGLSYFKELDETVPTLPPWRFTHDTMDYLDWMAQEIEWGPAPAYKIQAERDRWRQGNPIVGTMTQLVVPALDAQLASVNRVRASINSLRVLNALQGCQADAGTEPELAQLGFPADALLDPFTGRPLIVKRSAAGWTVYSLGRNLADDGGAVEKQLDVGVAPPLELSE